jgi:hypothetical protein
LKIVEIVISGAASVVDVVHLDTNATTPLAGVVVSGEDFLADMGFHVGRIAVSPRCHVVYPSLKVRR